MRFSKLFSLIAVALLVAVVFAGLISVPTVAQVVEAGTWNIETVDNTTGGGTFNSLALTSDGWPAISYFDWEHYDLKYAYKDASGWHNETVDSNGQVGGTGTSLALTSTGWPTISYYDNTNGDLKYAYKDAYGWHNETVDSNGNVGTYSSLTLTYDSSPVISYRDWTNTALKFAYKDASGWHNETVDSTGDAGEGTSLKLTSDGWPIISYVSIISSISYLKYAYKDAYGWHTETVDNTGDVGMYTSLAINSTGWPAISYFDNANTALKYAYKDASGWYNQTVDSAGDVGYFTSLAINSTGWPAISYYDWDNGDLKFAYQSASNQAPTAEAGPDQPAAHIGVKVTLQGRGTDPENNLPLTYSWSIKSKPDGSAIDLAGSDTATPSFTPDKLGEYIFELNVTDSLGAKSSPDTVKVTVVNVPPTANAGPDQTAIVRSTIKFDGSGSSDPDGDQLTYAWSIVSKPSTSTVTLSNPTSAQPKFIPDRMGTYVMQLIVNDGHIESAPDTVTITVNPTKATVLQDLTTLRTTVNNLPASVFKPGTKIALLAALNTDELQIKSNRYVPAAMMLQKVVLPRMDGCAKNSAPDSNDWVRTCPAQGQLYPQVQNLIQELQALRG